MSTAACYGLGQLLDTLPGQKRIADELCPGCPDRIPCGERGVADVVLSPSGHPEVWHVHGGMLPSRIIKVWEAGEERRCRRCSQLAPAAEWHADKRICRSCATCGELDQWPAPLNECKGCDVCLADATAAAG